MSYAEMAQHWHHSALRYYEDDPHPPRPRLWGGVVSSLVALTLCAEQFLKGAYQQARK